MEHVLVRRGDAATRRVVVRAEVRRHAPAPRRRKQRILLEGDVPTPINPPSGCRFHTRCPVAERGLCDVQVPPKVDVGQGHWAACHLVKPDGSAPDVAAAVLGRDAARATAPAGDGSPPSEQRES